MLEPGLVRARELQGLADLMLQEFERCLWLDLGPNSGARAMCAYSLGRVREAEQAAGSLRAAFSAKPLSETDFTPVMAARGLARYYAWTGNAEQSLAWLERAHEISPEGEDLVIIASGVYDKVRNEARFKAGLQRIRTQVYDRVQQARARPGRQ